MTESIDTAEDKISNSELKRSLITIFSVIILVSLLFMVFILTEPTDRLYGLLAIIFSLYYAIRASIYEYVSNNKEHNILASLYVHVKNNKEYDKLASLYKSVKNNKDYNNLASLYEKEYNNLLQKILLNHLPVIILNYFTSLSGFIALAIAYKIASYYSIFNGQISNNLDSGTALILIFLFIWGTIGISGWIPHYIIRAQIPK